MTDIMPILASVRIIFALLSCIVARIFHTNIGKNQSNVHEKRSVTDFHDVKHYYLFVCFTFFTTLRDIDAKMSQTKFS